MLQIFVPYGEKEDQAVLMFPIQGFCRRRTSKSVRVLRRACMQRFNLMMFGCRTLMGCGFIDQRREVGVRRGLLG